MYKRTNLEDNIIAVKKYQEKHIEMNRATSATYQKNHPENHRVFQRIYECNYSEIWTDNQLRAWENKRLSGLAYDPKIEY